ncbi:hypothetical protein RF11_14491 [Thelohanellus kitauei]|uniref:Uncharacterized protein n=1 Tax=Thelohanellus kitauei TaxID=669202 RepID=A0A0C2JU56_THEKT|nr:hypothetical protein RF11_14491 [Thelohanellus kitauei]
MKNIVHGLVLTKGDQTERHYSILWTLEKNIRKGDHTDGGGALGTGYVIFDASFDTHGGNRKKSNNCIVHDRIPWIHSRQSRRNQDSLRWNLLDRESMCDTKESEPSITKKDKYERP